MQQAAKYLIYDFTFTFYFLLLILLLWPLFHLSGIFVCKKQWWTKLKFPFAIFGCRENRKMLGLALYSEEQKHVICRKLLFKVHKHLMLLTKIILQVILLSWSSWFAQTRGPAQCALLMQLLSIPFSFFASQTNPEKPRHLVAL